MLPLVNFTDLGHQQRPGIVFWAAEERESVVTAGKESGANKQQGKFCEK